MVAVAKVVLMVEVVKVVAWVAVAMAVVTVAVTVVARVPLDQSAWYVQRVQRVREQCGVDAAERSNRSVPVQRRSFQLG